LQTLQFQKIPVRREYPSRADTGQYRPKAMLYKGLTLYRSLSSHFSEGGKC